MCSCPSLMVATDIITRRGTADRALESGTTETRCARAEPLTAMAGEDVVR